MRCPLDRVSLVLAAGAWMAAAAVVSPVLADECQCKKAAAAKAAAANPVEFFTIPELERLPMVGRLFKNEEAVRDKDGCADKCERIGVDFDFCLGKLGECPLGLNATAGGKCCAESSHVIAAAACSTECAKECGAKCAKGEGECPALAGKANACKGNVCITSECATGECAANTCGKGECGAAKCGAAKCCTAKCDAKCNSACAAECATVACCEAADCDDLVCCTQKCYTVAEGPETNELWEHIVELTGENAALAARLEAQAGREELIDELISLTADNAKLEAKVELAEAKMAIMQQMVQLAFENKQLQAHAAALTQQLQSHEAAARTSQRTPVLTPAR